MNKISRRPANTLLILSELSTGSGRIPREQRRFSYSNPQIALFLNLGLERVNYDKSKKYSWLFVIALRATQSIKLGKKKPLMKVVELDCATHLSECFSFA